MQPHYNLVYREEERKMPPYCLDSGVGVIPWSPLARGLLAGGRSRAGDRQTTRARTDTYAEQLYGEDDFAVADVVEQIAKDRGLPQAQIALAWLLHQEAVTVPVIDATKAGHIDDAVAAVRVRLSDDELAALEAPYRPHPVLGHS
jgi:aryl-alcohol dehydrogenase-like predicted oxidoreductase